MEVGVFSVHCGVKRWHFLIEWDFSIADCIIQHSLWPHRAAITSAVLVYHGCAISASGFFGFRFGKHPQNICHVSHTGEWNSLLFRVSVGFIGIPLFWYIYGYVGFEPVRTFICRSPIIDTSTRSFHVTRVTSRESRNQLRLFTIKLWLVFNALIEIFFFICLVVF